MTQNSSISLAERIDSDLKQAMRKQDTVTMLTLRAVKTSLTEATKASPDRKLDDNDVIAVVQKEAKRRRDAATEYERLGAADHAEQERAELAVLELYLPRQLTEAEITELAQEAIAETGASSPSDMGKVMSVVMGQAGGSADGRMVSQIVRDLLNS